MSKGTSKSTNRKDKKKESFLSLQNQALPIEEIPGELTLEEVQNRIDQDLPCESAEEYMLRAYLFDKKTPFNVDSKSKLERLENRTKKEISTSWEDWEAALVCPINYRPYLSWEKEVIERFECLRKDLEVRYHAMADRKLRPFAVPGLKDVKGWHTFTFGCDLIDIDKSDLLQKEEKEGTRKDIAEDDLNKEEAEIITGDVAHVTSPPLQLGVPRKEEDMDLDLSKQQTTELATINVGKHNIKVTKRKLDDVISNSNQSYLGHETHVNAQCLPSDSLIISSMDRARESKQTLTEREHQESKDRGNEGEGEQEYEEEEKEDTNIMIKEVNVENDIVENLPNWRLPLVSLILQFDQICTRKLLQYHVTWFEELPWQTQIFPNIDSNTQRANIPQVEQTRTWQQIEDVGMHSCLWLYALLAHLEMPLDIDTTGNIRHLYLFCWELRYDLYIRYHRDNVIYDDTVKKHSVKDSNLKTKIQKREHALIQGINTLLAIITRVFKQGGNEYERDLINDLHDSGKEMNTLQGKTSERKNHLAKTTVEDQDNEALDNDSYSEDRPTKKPKTK